MCETAGGALLQAILSLAREEGAKNVRLDVIDANPRARALYERTGFEALKEERYGILTRPFGFGGSTTMVYYLDRSKQGAGYTDTA